MKIDLDSGRKPDEWKIEPSLEYFIDGDDWLPTAAYCEILEEVSDRVDDMTQMWSDWVGDGRLLVEHLS